MSGSGSRRDQRSAMAEGGASTISPFSSSRLAPVADLSVAEAHAERFVKRAAFDQRAVQIDRALIARLAQQRDHALAFAEAIDADHMRALGKLRARLQQLRHLLARVAMLEHRQREGRLGDEQIARHELEGGAGRIGARACSRPRPRRGRPSTRSALARCRARGRQGTSVTVTSPMVSRLAIGRGLRARAAPACRAARSSRASVSARGEHVIVPGPRMIGMAMGDDRALGPAIRVDVEAARPAIEALPIDREPGVESVGSHFFRRCGEQITVLATYCELRLAIVVHAVARHAVANFS